MAEAMIAKYFRTYSTKILRQEKIFRDNGCKLGFLEGSCVTLVRPYTTSTPSPTAIDLDAAIKSP